LHQSPDEFQTSAARGIPRLSAEITPAAGLSLSTLSGQSKSWDHWTGDRQIRLPKGEEKIAKRTLFFSVLQLRGANSYSMTSALRFRFH
jgi:hypothetical protein